MSDHADQDPTVARLQAQIDALVAERDEARAANEAAKQFSYASHRRRAEAAEAELAIEREHNPNRVICPKCQANLPCESCKRYSALRDELEAEVARLREALALLDPQESGVIPDGSVAETLARAALAPKDDR